LFLFVVLLLPGFAYLVGTERHGTRQQMSMFREPAVIIAASVCSEIVVLITFAIVRVCWPSITPDVGALIRNSGAYVRGSGNHRGHYALAAIWVVGLLITAAILAYLAAVPKIRRFTRWATGRYPHESAVSAWWVLFEQWREGRTVEIACILDDGSGVRGQYGSFNISADDSPDRDIILRRPLYYRPPGGPASAEAFLNVSAACFSARRIVSMFVSYVGPDQQGTTTAPTAQAAAEDLLSAASLAAPQREAGQEAAMSSEARTPGPPQA
jgi:hypothetical protein